MKETVVIILAAGKSSRWAESRPDTLPESKILAPVVDDKNSLDIIISNLLDCGVNPYNIVIVTNQTLKQTVTERFPESSVVVQEEPLGNSHAAACALEEVTKREKCKSVVLLQGDDALGYTTDELNQMNSQIDLSDLVVMSTDPVKWPNFWQALTDEYGNILDIGKSGSFPRSLPGQKVVALANAFAIRKGAFINHIGALEPNPEEKNEIILPDFMRQLLKADMTLTTQETENFLGFNTYDEYLEAKKALAKRKETPE